MSGIGTCLWFAGQAGEAANFYVDVFPHSRIEGISRYPDSDDGVPGEVLSVSFVLDGRQFRAMNGAEANGFTEAISFELGFATQAELDERWFALTADGGE